MLEYYNRQISQAVYYLMVMSATLIAVISLLSR